MTDDETVITAMNAVTAKLAEILADLVRTGVIYIDDVEEILDDIECDVHERLNTGRVIN